MHQLNIVWIYYFVAADQHDYIENTYRLPEYYSFKALLWPDGETDELQQNH